MMMMNTIMTMIMMNTMMMTMMMMNSMTLIEMMIVMIRMVLSIRYTRQYGRTFFFQKFQKTYQSRPSTSGLQMTQWLVRWKT